MEKNDTITKQEETLKDESVSNDSSNDLCSNDDCPQFVDEIAEIDEVFDKSIVKKEKTVYQRNERRCHALFNYFRYLAYSNPMKVEEFWNAFKKISAELAQKGSEVK